MKRCHQCNTVLPPEAKFCFQCGTPQRAASRVRTGKGIDFSGDVQRQLFDRFFMELQRRIEEEHDSEQFRDYSERLYESGFRETIHRRTAQMAEQVRKMKDEGKTNRIEEFLRKTYQDLLDFFIIRYCQDLNQVLLPEAILKYQDRRWEETDLFRMALDYLDFANEEETVYTDFLVMPIDKLKNAGKFFLFPDKEEKILLICDQSMLGSCREGFALTERGIYWKAYLQTARAALYHQLHTIEREKDWITINGEFFNVNPSVNLKLMKFLRKVKEMMG